MPNFIVASSTTVPSDLSPSATTIVVAPPLAITPAGEHPYPENKNKSPNLYFEKTEQLTDPRH